MTGSENSNYGGLFGYIVGSDTQASVRNLVLVNVDVTGYAVAGALTGAIENGSLEHITVKGNIEIVSDKLGAVNLSAAGGVAGILYAASLHNCNVSFTNEPAAANISRLAVLLDEPQESPVTKGTISALQYAGGIAAKLDFSKVEAEAKADVTYSDLHVSNMTIKIEAKEEVEIEGSKAAGGLVGTSNATDATVSSLTVEDSDAKKVDIVYPKEEETVKHGGIIGEESADKKATQEEVATDEVTINGAKIKDGICLDVISEGFYEANTYVNGEKSEDSAQLALWYEIDSVEGLKAFRDSVNGAEGKAANDYSKKTVKLSADLDLESKPWTPIGTSDHPFKGNFDGCDYTISNLTVSNTYAGLFGLVRGDAIIENLTVVSATLTEVLTGNEAYAGAIVGKFHPSGDIAKLSNLHVENVNVLTAHRYAGGIVGQSYGPIYECTAKNVTINATPNQNGEGYDNGDKIGGIVGWFADDGREDLKNNYAENITLKAYRDVGGIAGYAGRAYAEGNTVKGVKITVDQVTNYYEGAATNAGYLFGRLRVIDSDNISETNRFMEYNANNTIITGEGIDYSLTYKIGNSTALQSALNEATDYGPTTINLAAGTYTGTSTPSTIKQEINVVVTGFGILADVRTANKPTSGGFNPERTYTRNIKDLTIQPAEGVEEGKVVFTTSLVMYDSVNNHDGLTVLTCLNADNITVKGLTFEDVDHPIYFYDRNADSRWKNITFDGNTMSWTNALHGTSDAQNGIHVYSENGESNILNGQFFIENLTVKNNKFTNTDYAIYAHNVTGLTVVNNDFNTYWHSAVGTQGSATGGDVLIQGNRVWNTVTPHDGSGFIRGSRYLGGTMTITNNVFYGQAANPDEAEGHKQAQLLINMKEVFKGAIATSGNSWVAAPSPDQAQDAKLYTIVEKNESNLNVTASDDAYHWHLELVIDSYEDKGDVAGLKSLSKDTAKYPTSFETALTITVFVDGTFDLGNTVVEISEFNGEFHLIGTDKATSIINGMLKIQTTGAVTAENITFQAVTGTTEGNIILNVIAGNGFTMKNCTVKRTTSETIPYGYVLSVVGNATIENSEIIAPFSAESLKDMPSALQVLNGKLTMSDSVIATNGFALFDFHVKNAELTRVTFSGLDGYYEGTDITDKTLDVAINCTTVEDITLDDCTIKQTKGYAMIIAGRNFTVRNCKFENTNQFDILLGYIEAKTVEGKDTPETVFCRIQSVTLEGNSFSTNTAAGYYPVVFADLGMNSDTTITVRGNKVNDSEDKFELGFVAQATDSLQYALNFLSATTTENIEQKIVVGLQASEENGGEFVLDAPLTINVPLTLRGVTGHETIKTSLTSGSLVLVNAAGVTIENLNFVETADETGEFQFIGGVGTSTTVKGCSFTGNYKDGDGEIFRAIVFNKGTSGYVIDDNTFTNVRQPAYIQGEGTVTNNTVSGTRGFVVECNYENVFTGNTFTNNVEDIAIIPGTDGSCVYTVGDAITISVANHNANVDVQPLGLFAVGNVLKATGFGGDVPVTASQAFVNILSYLNTLKGDKKNTTPITVQLSEGTYTPDANNQFRLEADNVSIVGAGVNEDGSYKTVIDALTYECSAQAGFEISGDNCSVSNVKFVASSESGNVSALKITKLDNETTIVKNFNLTNVEVVGKKGHALNLHGVDNVTVDNVKIGEHGKCGISIAKATDVLIRNTTFTSKSGWSSDIGFMYNTGDAYITPCEVTIDFATCVFAWNSIYSERPAEAEGGVDKIYSGATLESKALIGEGTAPEGWTYTAAESGTWTLVQA